MDAYPSPAPSRTRTRLSYSSSISSQSGRRAVPSYSSASEADTTMTTTDDPDTDHDEVVRISSRWPIVIPPTPATRRASVTFAPALSPREGGAEVAVTNSPAPQNPTVKRRRRKLKRRSRVMTSGGGGDGANKGVFNHPSHDAPLSPTTSNTSQGSSIARLPLLGRAAASHAQDDAGTGGADSSCGDDDEDDDRRPPIAPFPPAAATPLPPRPPLWRHARTGSVTSTQQASPAPPRRRPLSFYRHVVTFLQRFGPSRRRSQALHYGHDAAATPHATTGT